MNSFRSRIAPAVLMAAIFPLSLPAQDAVRRRVVLPDQPAVAQPDVPQPHVPQPDVPQPAVAQPRVSQPAVAQPAVPPAGGAPPAVLPPVASPPVAAPQSALPIPPGNVTPPSVAPASPEAAEEDIRPAKKPVPTPDLDALALEKEAAARRKTLLVWAGAAGGLIGLGSLFWILSRDQRRTAAAMDRAVAALESVDRRRNALAAGPLADGTAAAVRQFIAERFRIAAPQRTTEEFLHDLARSGNAALGRHRETLAEFLKSCDMAKFAAAELDAAERRALLERAFAFVRAAGNTPEETPPPVREGQSRNPAAT